MAQCAFAKVVVNDVWESKWPYGTDLEGRFVYMRDGAQQWLLAAFDFSYMFRRTSLAWRQAIAAETGIPVANIWVHELQLHSAPIALDMDGEPCNRLIQRTLPVVREMIANAAEAEMSHVVVDLGERFNMNREQYIPGLGRVTVWHGCEFDEENRPYSQNPEIMLLAGWKPELPAFGKKIYFDGPADPQAALLVFRRRSSGEVLGTISRFSGHADIVGACVSHLGTRGLQDLRYHFDWPGYMRRTLDTQLGGTGVCVCGPCGNLSTKKRAIPGYESGDRQSNEIGGGVARTCLEAWRKQAPPWLPLKLGKQAHTQFGLPLRESFPRSTGEVQQAKNRAQEYHDRFKAAIAAGACPALIKQLIDEHYHWSWVPNIANRWAGLSEQELQDHAMQVEVETIRINDLVLAGLPGESMTETCLWLRANSVGNRLIVMDQVNGYCAYQTTSEQYDEGGYAYGCSCLSRDATSITRRKAAELIGQVL